MFTVMMVLGNYGGNNVHFIIFSPSGENCLRKIVSVINFNPDLGHITAVIQHFLNNPMEAASLF